MIAMLLKCNRDSPKRRYLARHEPLTASLANGLQEPAESSRQNIEPALVTLDVIRAAVQPIVL